MRSLVADDFKREPRGGCEFYTWSTEMTVPSPLGDFAIEAMTPIGDTKPPDQRMLDLLNEMVALVEENGEAILEQVYEHYQKCSDDTNWMEICDVPVGLSREEIKDYLTAIDIVVDREEPTAHLLVTPEWDEEHAIYFEIEDGKLCIVDR